MEERVKLRLYIQGIRTKINTITTSCGEWQIPTAMIVIPPSEYSKHIPFGTKVHVFEWDTEIEDWIILFDGYVSGISHSKSSASWSSELSCIGHGKVWQRIYKFLYFLDKIEDKEAYDEMGGSAELISVRCYFENLVKYYGETNDVLSAISNILTWKTGDAYTKNGKSAATGGGNERQTSMPTFVNNALYGGPKLAFRLYGLETSAAIKKILQAKEFKEMLNGRVQNMAGQTTLFQLAATVMQYAFHGLLSIAQPTNSSTGIMEYIIKPVSYYAYPPKCNVVHPGNISSISYHHNYESEPTRLTSSISPSIFLSSGEAAPKVLQNMKYAPELGGTFGDMKISKIDAGHKISLWEVEHGMNLYPYNLDADIGVALIQEGDEEKLQTFLNMVYMDKFLSSRSLTATVDPTLKIVPGASILLLDGSEVRAHILGYVSSVTRVVSAVGQSSINLTISHARMYSEICDGYASEVDPLVADHGELVKYHKLLGTEPAFSNNDAQTVQKEIDDYSKLEKRKWNRDICTQDEFMSFIGVSFNGEDLKGTLYSDAILSRDRFWGRRTETSEPSLLIDIDRQELIRKHNGVLAGAGIRG